MPRYTIEIELDDRDMPGQLTAPIVRNALHKALFDQDARALNYLSRRYRGLEVDNPTLRTYEDGLDFASSTRILDSDVRNVLKVLHASKDDVENFIELTNSLKEDAKASGSLTVWQFAYANDMSRIISAYYAMIDEQYND